MTAVGWRRRVALALLLILALTSACTRDESFPRAAPSGLDPGYRLSDPPPTPDPDASFDLEAALEVVRRSTYAPERPEGPLKGPLRAIWATCTGSVNGRCQAVFFFYGQRLVDRIEGILVRVVAQDGRAVQLELPRYRSGDAGCCPTGRSTRHTARIVAERVVVTPPIPADPNGSY
ncbi:LppP/LprE lipoprotein [Micromonospora sediminicola]|uniref:LppP/LprE lipoprotein n=1 Tax=Micromonospora sediminicola TaxID=946078 RepID=A0A1A9B9F4_9ACTN|nr:LppP/LprE family lipoprotein [Micromonospora sediminicola]SBT65773.1 LppP/LprE lipoprotein [Micromonospora sediminicola]